MAKSKEQKQEQPKTDALASMKSIAKAFKNKINLDHQAAIAYVADKETVPKVTVSSWVPMGEAFQDSVKIPGLPIGNITHVYGKPDTGKCHPKDTPILMHDGSIRMVQDLKLGDKLMGPDSLPRTVLSLGTGEELIYEIEPNYGDSWKCNESHILSLVCNQDRNHGKLKFIKGNVYNIPLKAYLDLPDHVTHSLKLYRAKINFTETSVPYDPYFVGLWLGDGVTDRPVVTQDDDQLEEYFELFAEKVGLKYVRKVYKDADGNSKCPIHSFVGAKGKENALLQFLRTLVLNDEKRIPKNYLINDENVRLQVLAGLIDSDGHNNCAGYEYITKWKGLRDDVLFLARSLGFRATHRVKMVNNVPYFRINITGHCEKIPVKLDRKIISPKEGIFKNPLTTGFSVKKLDKDIYYGFELDGDHLYLLGDFTVTHNTTILMEAIAGCQSAGILPILILTEHKFDFSRLEEWFGVDLEAMVVCHADTIDQAYNIQLKMLKSIQEGKLVVPTEEGKDDAVIDIDDQVCYILLDSVGNSFSESEMAYEVEEIDKAMGKAAKTIKALTKRVNYFLGKVRQRCGVLILNQSYQSMPSYGPSVETPYGGDGIPYSCVLNIRLRRVKDLIMTIKGVDTVVGLETKIQVMKNHITHLKPITSVYTVAYGLIPPTKEALDEFKKSLR